MESKPRVGDGLISMVPTASVWWANCVAGRVEEQHSTAPRPNSGWSCVETNWRTVRWASAVFWLAHWTWKMERRESVWPPPAQNFVSVPRSRV